MTRHSKNLPNMPRVMDVGAHSDLIAAYAAELKALGYTRLTITPFYTDPARHLIVWLQRSAIRLADVDESIFNRFVQHNCGCLHGRKSKTVSHRYATRVRRFIIFLADCGLITPLAKPPAETFAPRVDDFMRCLKHHRGISDTTAASYGRLVMRLLANVGQDPSLYTPASVRKAVLTEVQQCSRHLAKAKITALRIYLRYLSGLGLCPPRLEEAIPRVPEWRLSSLPRYISAADVERVISSCDLSVKHGLRDRAILLLLARLGLRVGDVYNMCLSDIDWLAGAVVVNGKGRRQVRLPLPQEVGDAILAYIEQARPEVAANRLFLRSCAPYWPLTSPTTISIVVKRALKRARIVDPPSWGGNLLRHSVATAMLRGGASLQAVGAILRHRSLDTTAHYAKVDLPMLLRVAQPWPGERSC
jgi:integrase/recombinase XerD